jgi:hypothetical protein
MQLQQVGYPLVLVEIKAFQTSGQQASSDKFYWPELDGW